MYMQLDCLWIHDDVIKWKYFPRYWPFVREIHRSPVNFPHKGQWRGTLMFTLICARMNGWVNNGEAGDLRRYLAHYDVIVMSYYKTELPCVFNNMFGFNRTEHNYGTRQKDLYNIPSFSLDIAKNSIRYRGVIVWNQITSHNDNFRLHCSINSFKFHLRRGIINGILSTNAPSE